MAHGVGWELHPRYIPYRNSKENAIPECTNPVIGPDACCETLEPQQMCNTCWLGERVYWMQTAELEPANYEIYDEDDNPTDNIDTEKWFKDNTSTPSYWKKCWNYELGSVWPTLLFVIP